MQRRIPLLALLAMTASWSHATTLQQYLSLRQQHSIREAVGVATLETFVGTRIAEIKGEIKGSIRVGEEGTVMLETGEGRPIPITAKPVPNWMVGGGVRGRLLVRATRSHETAPLRAELLGAVPEAEMSAWEARQRPATRATSTPAPQRGASPSRSGSRTRTPAPMPGNIETTRVSSQRGRTWYVPASDAVPYYRDFILQRNRRLSRQEAERIAEGVIGFSLKYGVDARLVMAMIIVESGFNPNATSHAGAMGLGQLMPGTARGLGVSNAYDSVENLYGMVKLIRGHIDRYHRQTGGDEFETLVLMLAAYNAGPGAVRRHGGVPPFRETQNYVRKVTAIYRQLTGES